MNKIATLGFVLLVGANSTLAKQVTFDIHTASDERGKQQLYTVSLLSTNLSCSASVGEECTINVPDSAVREIGNSVRKEIQSIVDGVPKGKLRFAKQIRARNGLFEGYDLISYESSCRLYELFSQLSETDEREYYLWARARFLRFYNGDSYFGFNFSDSRATGDFHLRNESVFSALEFLEKDYDPYFLGASALDFKIQIVERDSWYQLFWAGDDAVCSGQTSAYPVLESANKPIPITAKYSKRYVGSRTCFEGTVQAAQ